MKVLSFSWRHHRGRAIATTENKPQPQRKSLRRLRRLVQRSNCSRSSSLTETINSDFGRPVRGKCPLATYPPCFRCGRLEIIASLTDGANTELTRFDYGRSAAATRRSPAAPVTIIWPATGGQLSRLEYLADQYLSDSAMLGTDLKPRGGRPRQGARAFVECAVESCRYTRRRFLARSHVLSHIFAHSARQPRVRKGLHRQDRGGVSQGRQQPGQLREARSTLDR